MSEWKEYKLGEICTSINYGYTASANSTPVGPKFLRITDIVPERVNWNNVPYCEISKEDAIKYKLEKGDIVIARTGATTGFNYTFKDDIDAVFASYLIRYKLDKTKAEATYINYLLKTNKWKGFVEGIMGGSAQPGANAQMFASFDFLLPPLSEQQSISSILSSLDDKIDLLQRQNKTLEQLAETLFRQWFVEEASEDWEVGTLGKIGRVVTGKTPSTKIDKFWGTEIPFITPTDFKNFEKYVTFSERFLSVSGKDSVKNAYLPAGAILVTCIGSDMGKVAISTKPLVTNQQINSLVVNSDFVYPEYIYQYLKSIYPLLRSIALGGTTMPIINKSDFENIEMPIPDKKTLLSFETLSSSFNIKIKSNTKQIQSLTSLKDALLPKLMSGEVRVKM